MLDNISYLAGIIDGEGHIAFSGCGKGRKRFVIEVKMTSELIIDWLKENYGGKKAFRPSKNPKHKDQWRWRVQDSEAKLLYMQIKPLLKIKNTIEV